jgi:peptidoglycan/LPS O-acetylase OafA/YrhL
VPIRLALRVSNRQSVLVATGLDAAQTEHYRGRRSWPVRLARAFAVIGLCLLPPAVALATIATTIRAIQTCTERDNIGTDGRIGAAIALITLPLLGYLLAGMLLILFARWTRWHLARVAIVTVGACAVVAAAYLWLRVGQYPTSVCPDGTPDWWPSWVPVRTNP